MRQCYLPLALLCLAACSRESVPPRTFGSAPPPPPSAIAAQAAPAAAKAAEVTGVPAPTPAVATAAKPQALPATALAGTGNVAKPKDPQLDKFHEEQRRRDAQLMAQDAEEAARQAD
jgi:hypothetical protein